MFHAWSPGMLLKLRFQVRFVTRPACQPITSHFQFCKQNFQMFGSSCFFQVHAHEISGTHSQGCWYAETQLRLHSTPGCIFIEVYLLIAAEEQNFGTNVPLLWERKEYKIMFVCNSACDTFSHLNPGTILYPEHNETFSILHHAILIRNNFSWRVFATWLPGNVYAETFSISHHTTL